MLISDPTVVVLVHSNTRTLLACQKLDQDGREANSSHGETNEISTLLASNVSFLDGLAKIMPRVAVAQREIQNLIQKNGFQGSSEAFINDGLPLTRRHSRQDLLDKKGQRVEQENRIQVSRGMAENRGSIQSLTDLNTTIPLASTTGPRLEEPLVIYNGTLNMAPIHRSNGEANIYTPVSLEQRGPHPVGLPNHQAGTEPTEMGETLGWRNAEFSLPQGFYGGEAMENVQVFGMCEHDYIGEALGYFAPFEIATQDDMNTATVFAGDKGQYDSRDFGTQS